MSIKISKNFMALVLVISISGGMIGTKAMGIWSDVDGLKQAVQESKKQESKEVLSNSTSGEKKEQNLSVNISVSEIRGSSTFAQVSEVYGVPVEDIIKAFSLDKKLTGDTKAKELPNIFETDESSDVKVGPSAVRYFIAMYIGEEYEPSGEELLPKAAVDLLAELNKLNASDIEYFKAHTLIK